MKTDDFASYDLALKLKACGFNEPCEAFYEHINGEMYFSVDGNEDWNSGVDYSAPLLYHAQKWLREKWGMHVDVCPYSDYSTDADGNVCDRWNFWGFDLYAVVGGKKIADDDGEYDSYEQALSAGIAAALELITKG